jgi:hypothetical protein
MIINQRPQLPAPKAQQETPPQQPPAKPGPENKDFNYNAQDEATLAGDTATVSVKAADGGVETESVILDNKKAVFFFGRLIALRDDANYKLSPNADGNFVYPKEHASHTGANTVSAAAQTVNKYNEVLGELTGKKIEWAFGEDQLLVSPETGEWPNAFYARQMKGIHFFDVKNTSTGNSGEVVSHEAGHAILDALRPNYLGGTGAETGAFHEAFGDTLAMLMTLGNEQAVDKIIAQTEGGDLSAKRNALSDMGEGFGEALGMTGGIRTSFNDFTWKDPSTLPERGSETQLGHEVHDFSRLWSGAFYDVVDGISDANRAAGMSPKEALMAAGEEGWKLLVGQMEASSAGSETNFKRMAQNLMAGDAKYNGGQRQDLIRDVMVKRELMEAGEGLFKSATPEFSGQVVSREITFGENFGALAGVKMETKIDQPIVGGFFQRADTSLAMEAQKGARLMLQNEEILFTDKGEPGFDQLFKADGTAFKAYVTTNEAGEKELHRVPIAVCDFSGHNHNHAHGESCDH